MNVSSWLKKWLAAVIVCVTLLTGSCLYLLMERMQGSGDADEIPVVNQARLKVSDMIYDLERDYAKLSSDGSIRDPLRAKCEALGVSLTFVQLDGTVIFQSDTNEPIPAVDLRSVLHYDLYASKMDKGMYKLAFPVIDPATEAQIGNALFTLPAASVVEAQADPVLWIAGLLSTVSLIVLLLLLWQLHRKMKYGILGPIRELKDYSEAILKGNYEQNAEYSRVDELGELYAIFDQMRLEIKFHSQRRDKQEKAQRELITNISHELKTPLATINAYIDAIQGGVCTDEDSLFEYIGVMKNHTSKMTRLVEDLLLHALRELGQISVFPTEQYSHSVLLPIIKPLSHYVRSAGIQFVEPEPFPNVLFLADANRLELVISNLVANSLKHTKAGDTISMSVELEREKMKITIADTGEGILPQDMPFIFERYYQGSRSDGFAKKSQEGNGLGLSICKHIIEAHNGSISFKSAKGQGTVFSFTLPLG